MDKSIKLIFKKIDIQSQVIQNLIREIKENWGDEERIVELFINSEDYCFSNLDIINLLADFLQTSDSKDIYNEFSLEDIASLYEKNIEMNAANISTYIELVNFYDSVLPNEQKAEGFLELAKDLLNRNKTEINSLEERIKRP